MPLARWAGEPPGDFSGNLGGVEETADFCRGVAVLNRTLAADVGVYRALASPVAQPWVQERLRQSVEEAHAKMTYSKAAEISSCLRQVPPACQPCTLGGDCSNDDGDDDGGGGDDDDDYDGDDDDDDEDEEEEGCRM